MDSLIRIQEDIMKKIQRAFTNYKKSPKDRITTSYVETRIETLEGYWVAFETTHQKLVSESVKEVFEKSDYCIKDVYGLVEDLYTEYKTELKERLKTLTKVQKKFMSESHSDAEQIGVKLPRIAIPTFSGRYSEWTTFRDLYVSLIHDNEALKDVQKLHYLKSYLTGEAEQLLRHLPISSDNYAVCWELLHHRFNNKRYTTNCILKKFFSQKNVVHETSSALKELFDNTNECLNALKNVGINIENWDAIVIYILSLKLDTESRKQWESKICDLTNELPTLNQFLEFLEHRFRALEFLSPKSIKTSLSHHVVNNSNDKKVVSCSFCSECSHKLGNCKEFAKESLSARRNFVQTSNLCYNCLGANHSVTSCRLPTRCRICKGKHHSLLHTNNSHVLRNSTLQSDDNNVVAATATTSGEIVETKITTCFSNNENQVLLATALVKAETNNGSLMTLRSLLDQGSQASFITEAAVQLLGLKEIPTNSVITGVGGDENTSLNSKHIVLIKLHSVQDPSFTITIKAYVLKKLTSLLPKKRFMVKLWPTLPRMTLADPKFNIPNKIDLLLGAEVYSQILIKGLTRCPQGSLIAQNTRFGWIISGEIKPDVDISSASCHTIVALHAGVINEEFDLKKFWDMESDTFSLKKPFTPEEQRCEDWFEQTTTRDLSGRYVVKLPFKNADPICKYGNSRQIAIKRFLSLEKRLFKSEDIKMQYSDVIKEYLDLGHMEVIPAEEVDNTEGVYLPHHAVIRADKTTSKLRVVFDASCSDCNGVSLNSELMVGPTLQADLRHTVMRWRLHPICLVADIIKMYRQIKVASSDIDFQRLIWRTSPEENLQHMRLLRVTFGTAPAPFLAVRALHQAAYDNEITSSAYHRILKDFYMDDLLTGCQSISEGKELYLEINRVLNKAGFELQKWSSNNEELLNEINQDKKDIKENKELKVDEIIKILGLTWNRRTDNFEYSVQLPPISYPVTKRKVISDIAKLFDPMGWIAPTIIRAKIFIQRIWLAGITWDEELSPPLLNDWLSYREELITLTKFHLPRWISITQNHRILELHGFSDASNDAYAAVVYARVVDESERVHVHLITCKTKVAPIKQVSIPRLELCGAVLLVKLLREVAEVLNVSNENLHAWTDSTIVLAWLSCHPSRWKTFVANRVSDILNILDRDKWAHVSSTDNPADCASRGIRPSECENVNLWKTGPSWLSNLTIYYPRTNIDDTNLEVKSVKICHVADVSQNSVWSKFSSLRKLLRVVSYCRRFIARLKGSLERYPVWLTNKELTEVLNMSIRVSQSEHFYQEIHDLTKNITINKKSKLTALTPFLDQEHILRVGGRLERSEFNLDKRHPIILAAKSHLTYLIISEAHEKTLHGGPQLMINFIRSKYWILDLKNLVKLYVRKCIRCVRYSAQTRDQLMGQLPPARVTPLRPFYQSGVDYAGPILIRTSKGRGHRAHKGYIVLFVCMATRAVHLEVVSDLTAQGFIAAFKRFVARRGHCVDIYSDNGTNFVGAARELKTLWNQEKSTLTIEIAESLASNGTTWHFIPPHAPHFGGLWEAGIKSTKHHLKRVIGTHTLTFEEMSTLLYQIEACLNSRPLSQISTNSEDPLPLTPGHFLIGEPVILVPEQNYEKSSIPSLKRWQLTQRMLQSFWRRWSDEYLTQFMHRYKWAHQKPEPNIGDLVLVREDNLPPAKWLLGVITDKHQGLDNITRVVSLKCKDVIIKRPVTKLCILPVNDVN